MYNCHVRREKYFLFLHDIEHVNLIASGNTKHIQDKISQTSFFFKSEKILELSFI